MRDIYVSDQYAELNPSWHEGDSPWKARQIGDMIARHNITFDTACEIGCGTGEILLNLSRRFPQAHFDGWEIAPHAYLRAQQKETNSVRFHLGDALAEKKDVHDVVIIADVIEHVENYIGFISGIKPLGRYKIFHIPLDLSVQSVLRGTPIENLRRTVGHLHYFTKDTALATIRDCGYKVVDHCYTASRLELPDQAWSSRVMAVPRKLLFSLSQDWTVRVLGGYSLLVLAE